MDGKDGEGGMKAETQAKLRLGRIGYLNTFPFYHGLATSGGENLFELSWQTGTPAQINQAMQEGRIDIAPVSSLEYLNHQDQYLLFPELCIGSRDFSASVLLLSREQISGLDGAAISLTEESLSAATLLKILLHFKFRFTNPFRVEPSNAEAMLSQSKACLVIGDEALFFRPKEFIYKTDLSQLWWDWTELPFCFSVWAVRRPYYEKHAAEVNSFYRTLKSNTERNLLDIEKILKDGLQITLADEKFPIVFGYLFNLNYYLDDEMQHGLELFYRLAHRLGVAPKPRQLNFIEPEEE